MAPPSKVWMRCRIAFAIIGILVGVSVFLCFGVVYKNWDAAVWGLVSGVFAAATLGVHIKYLRDGWKVSAHMLKPLMLTGCFVQLAGVCAFVAYLSLAISEHQGVTAYGRGFYVTCVWGFMTWKWGFGLFYYSRSYKRLYEETTGLSADTGYEPIPKS